MEVVEHITFKTQRRTIFLRWAYMLSLHLNIKEGEGMRCGGGKGGRVPVREQRWVAIGSTHEINCDGRIDLPSWRKYWGVFFPTLNSRFNFFLIMIFIIFLKIHKHESLLDGLRVLHVCVMATTFNYFNFVSEKSCFLHQFDMVDGSKYYDTHEAGPPLLRRRRGSEFKALHCCSCE